MTETPAGDPRRLLPLSYETWLRNALSEGSLNLDSRDNAKINAYATRFNGELSAVVVHHGEERANEAIWYIYGCVSGYAWQILDKSLGDARFRFMDSLRLLYQNGFQKYCARYFGHLDDGPERLRPLNSSCYMLWDMDGIECPALNGDSEMLEASLEILEFALTLDHPACQESALHGLGHFVLGHSAKTTPIIRRFLRAKPEANLAAFAKDAIAGCVQ